jgi:hypothetical protein
MTLTISKKFINFFSCVKVMVIVVRLDVAAHERFGLVCLIYKKIEQHKITVKTTFIAQTGL